MGSRRKPRTLIFFGLVIAGILAITARSYSPVAASGIEPRKWEFDLTPYSRTCNDGTLDCHFSSPVLADISDDGLPDVIVATNKGYVVAIRNDGVLLWVRDVAPSFGMAAGTHEITSSPAVADIDNDGFPEIAVGVGTTQNGCSPVHHGGMIVLEHTGTVKAGWPQETFDDNGDGCKDTINSTPALANLDADPQLEIVAGGFDKRIYAWNHDGSLVDGFPPDSYLAQRFPTWPNLQGALGDTVWSSPALADLDLDGKLDIVIGTDEGMLDDRYGGDMGEWAGWTCPYALPAGWAPGSCGGSLYGLTASGDLLPNFPRYYLEAVASSPAVGDANGDGLPEIFVGQGTFYHNNSADHPTYGYRLYGLDRQGQELPGWIGGKTTLGAVYASPALGDITGDSRPEIVVGTMDSWLYAYNFDGTLVNGFPMKPRKQMPGLSPGEFPESVVLGDYDGDGKMEIFINNGWTTTVIDGNSTENGEARQLTGDDFPNNTLPIYYSFGSLINSPAVGDLDGDGKLELVTQNHKVYVFDLDSAGARAEWPMEQGNPARTAMLPIRATLAVKSSPLILLHDLADTAPEASGSFLVDNVGGTPMDWSATEPAPLTLSATAGILGPQQNTTVTVTVPVANFGQGLHTVGTVELTATAGEEAAIGSPANVVVKLLVGNIQELYIPTALK